MARHWTHITHDAHGRVVMHAVCTRPRTSLRVVRNHISSCRHLTCQAQPATCRTREGGDSTRRVWYESTAAPASPSSEQPCNTWRMPKAQSVRDKASKDLHRRPMCVPCFPGLTQHACTAACCVCRACRACAGLRVAGCCQRQSSSKGDARHWRAASHQGGTASIASDRTLSKLYNMQLFWPRHSRVRATQPTQNQPGKLRALQPLSKLNSPDILSFSKPRHTPVQGFPHGCPQSRPQQSLVPIGADTRISYQ
jgi:hypothetical protein